jgi:hypothetical protein
MLQLHMMRACPARGMGNSLLVFVFSEADGDR